MSYQLFTLFVLALPVASIAWTITHEDLFREVRTMCADRSKSCRSLAARKFFYLFTCEYCFSHYVTIVVLAITRFHLLFPDWRDTSSWLRACLIANIYISVSRCAWTSAARRPRRGRKALEESKRWAAIRGVSACGGEESREAPTDSNVAYMPDCRSIQLSYGRWSKRIPFIDARTDAPPVGPRIAVF